MEKLTQQEIKWRTAQAISANCRTILVIITSFLIAIILFGDKFSAAPSNHYLITTTFVAFFLASICLGIVLSAIYSFVEDGYDEYPLLRKISVWGYVFFVVGLLALFLFAFGNFHNINLSIGLF